MVAQSTQLTQMAQERIDSFERYGSVATNFACHAAFPLSLTTELSYCLREKFFPNPDLWSIAPQLLLSGLCDRKDHDLYVMDFSVRGALLKKLLENEKFGTARLDELADFMAGYILDGISQKTRDITHEQIFSERSRVFGYPPAIIKFTALSLLKQDSELTAIIRRELQDLLRQTTHPRDRLHLAMFVENQDNLLESMGLTSFSLLDLAQSIVDDTSGDELERVRKVMKQHNFPVLQQQTVKYPKVSFAENTVDTGDTLYSFEFETVIVDVASKIVARNQREAFAFREPLENGIELEMVAIPSGKFTMGGSEEDPDSKHRGTLTMGGSRGDLDNKDREYPQHEVILQPFYISRYPITQSQWRAVATYSPINLEISLNPSRFEGKNLPVEWVSWDEAQEFCKRLSARTGRNYCLPSEAQWEYACRAGSETAFHYGRNTSLHLFNCRSGCTTINGKDCLLLGKTSEVGIFPANNWGLYDMHGNVWEWCKDDWHSNYSDAPNDGSAWVEENCDDKRVIRGGSWNQEADRCRSSHRGYYSSSDHLSSLTRSAPQGPRSETGTTIGFRVCCIP
jgi:formylglycine-generating enzyme required for sulfatase activity